MTNTELIKALQHLPPNTDIKVCGCSQPLKIHSFCIEKYDKYDDTLVLRFDTETDYSDPVYDE